MIRRTLLPKTTNPVEEKKRDFFSLTEEYLAAHKLSESRIKHFKVLVRTLKRLPVLLLDSSERNTGKTTCLNLLKLIFGGNVSFNTNEDFRS